MSYSEHVSTETLADYAEGLLRESDASAVAAHLADCAECRAEELLLASLSEILAADHVGPMPAVYADRIDAALHEVALAHPAGSRSAGSDPGAGSFHPEGAYAGGGALDLTPSALASSSSAEVIDLAARRKVVAQGLSRVTTVAASIVLLIGGTVLGLQALNSGDDQLDSPNEIAQPSVQPFARETIQPSPIRNSRVPIYVGAKKNPDGSYTNPNGVVVRPDGSAVLLNGKVLKPQKKSAGGGAEPVDPTIPVGPLPADNSPSKSNNGPVSAFDKNRDTADEAPPAVVQDPADPAVNNPATPEPDETPATAPDSSAAPAADDSAEALRAEGSDGPRTAPADDPVAEKSAQQRPYVEESGSEYTTDNFAEKVLALLDRAGYRESSVGEPQVAAGEPTSTVAPSESARVQDAQFQEASVNAAAPTAADSPTVAERAEVQGPASGEVKRRAVRCARQLGGDLIAGDTGIWKGDAVTVVVLPDPSDPRQVVAHAVAGPCTAERPADDPENLRHIQFIVAKP